RDREPVDTRTLEHPRRAVEGLVHHLAAAFATEPGLGSPLRAPRTAHLVAHRLAAVDAQLPRDPVARLRPFALLTDRAHASPSTLANAPPQNVLVGLRHRLQLGRDRLLGNALTLEEHAEVEFC